MGATAAKIQVEIDKMLQSGIIEVSSWQEKQVIPPIFTRDKKDGSVRIILDLSVLNTYLVYRHFKMDTFETALNLVTKNCFFASIDWKDAYYTVPVAVDDRRFLKFRWGNNLYQFTALPNGLAPAPRIFTKISKVLFAELRKRGHVNTSFIDDCLLIGESRADCLSNVKDTILFSEAAGFMIHPEKSILHPTQSIIYLGFVIDSVKMTVSLTPERANKLHSLAHLVLSSVSITIQKLAELVGMMVASFPAVTFCQLYYRRCDNFKTMCLKQSRGSYTAKIRLPHDCRTDLNWWEVNIRNCFAPIGRNPPCVTLMSDASTMAWGVENWWELVLERNAPPH